MRLELSEVLACPRCGPPQGIVVVVETSEAGRVREGFAACPACDVRCSIRGGVLWIEGEEGTPGLSPVPVPKEGNAPSPGAGSEPLPPADAEMLAALLDCRGEAGCVLLGRGLASVAAAVASLLERPEVVVLESGSDPLPASRAELPISRLRGASDGALPVLDDRLRGVALLGGSADSLAEAVRTLRRGGRLVILRPAPELALRATEHPLELLAADSRALVATRVDPV